MTKSIFVTIAGRANVGKSSLLNAVIGEKIAIVSNKPQTTRTKITGVLTKDEVQYVFIDTPGMHKARTKLGTHMVDVVKQSITDIDIVILVADAAKPFEESELELLAAFKTSRTPVILALNKIDLIDKELLGHRIEELAPSYDFASIVPMSAKFGDGVDVILSEVGKHAAQSPHFFPDDMLTDQPERVIAAEMIREQALALLSEEVPHGIAVVIEEMKERQTGDKDILDISANIFCERDSHKGIVIGKNGAMLKEIGSRARVELEAFFQIKVNLQCWVKVKQDWRNKEGMIKNFGLNNNRK